MKQLLVTALVVVAVVAFLRFRAAATGSRSSAASAVDGRHRLAGYALVAILLAGITTVVYLQWAEAHRVVTVRVIDTGSGQVTEYPVYKKDLGGRRFETVNGREVSLSASDRMELDRSSDD